MDFEVKGFCAENLEEKIHKRYLWGNPLLPHGQKNEQMNNQATLGWPAQGQAKAVPSAGVTLGLGTLPVGRVLVPMPAPSPS